MNNEPQQAPAPQLVMRRKSLADLPPVVLPEGYTIRHWQPGDSEAWDAIYADAFGIAYSPGAFYRIIRSDGPFRPERVWFVCKGNNPVATASAWRVPKYGTDAGFLHFVAVLRSESGQKLGLSASLAAMNRMALEGRTWAVLQTDDHRLAAIKQYLRLGFEPLLVHENQRERWHAVLARLDLPDATARCGPILKEPLFELRTLRSDKDRPDRYTPRLKWLPNRQHLGGIGGGDMDFMADESLYRPSQLGSAAVEPATAIAGSLVEAFTLRYTPGPAGIAEGSRVVFEIRGQAPLGFPLIVSCQPAPGKLLLHGPAGVEFDPYNHFGTGFTVRKGNLDPGQKVMLTMSPAPGQRWKPVAGMREIKVAIYPGHGEPGWRLPEPVRLEILPATPDHIEALVPCTAQPGAPITANITIRDRWDNRVPLRSAIETVIDDITSSVAMFQGRAFAEGVMTRKKTLTPRATLKEMNLPCRSNICIPADDGLNLYVGDLHCHDFLSQAEGYPDAIYRYAIEDKRLDFLVLSPQSHGWHDNETWTIAKYMNERFLDEGRFVPLLGYEWQHTGYGDKVVIYLGGDQPVLPVDDNRYSGTVRLYEALRASDALAISHHSAYPPGSWCAHTSFDTVEDDVERLIELWSMHGSSEGYDPADRPLKQSDPAGTAYEGLRRGLRLGFVGGSDSHSGRPGGSAQEPLPYWGGLTALWAPRLTRRDVFEALWARHTYAITEARIVLKMTVNGALMGSEIPAAEKAHIRVQAWAPGPIRCVEIMKNTRVLRTLGPFGTECRVEERDRTGGPAFYHCRITMADGNLAVCSPVWVGHGQR